MLTKLQAKIRYLVDKAFARKFVGQFLLFMTLVVSVTLVGTTAMFFGLFAEENAAISSIPRDVDAGFLDSTWWSLNQVVRLPGFQRAYGATLPVVLYSLFLSLMGLVVFSVLISLINNTMRSRIEELRKGDTPVLEHNHVLILGWNNKVFSILQLLARLQPGLKVVILAPRAIDDMQEQLRIAGIQRERVKVILRSGTPSDHGELDRVAVERADSVIVLATDSDDSEVIKTMVLLTSRKQWPGEPPVLTAEIARSDSFELASIAARNRVHVISSSQIISKVLVQTIRNPGLSDVYGELFSADGNGIAVQFLAESIDRPMAEIAYKLSAAIPLGIAWDQTRDGIVRHLAGLNPEPDYEVAEDERLVLLTRSPTVSYVHSGKMPESRIYQEGTSVVPHVPAQVLLIGWIDNLAGLLQELDAHALHGTEVTIISRSLDKKPQQQPVNDKADDFSHLTLVKHEGDPVAETTYEDLDIASFQSIVVLADESDEDQDADTRSLRILLRLSDLLGRTDTKIHTVVEILDENNRALFSDLGVDDIVVSSEVVAAQLAQIAHRDVLAPIYRELLSAGGVEISLRPAGDYVLLDTDCQFADLLYAGHQKMEITLGLLLASDDGKLLLNPPRDASWRLGEDDKVIVLAQQVYQ
jgi:voltage-gated potassium channel Kch